MFDSRLFVTRQRYAAGLRLPRHAHDDCSLIVTVRGSFIERTEAGPRTVAAGTVLLRAAGEPHANEFVEPTVCLAVRLPSPLLEAGLELDPVRTLVKGGRRVAALCARLARESAGSDPASQLAAWGITLELVAELVRRDERAAGRAGAEVERVRNQIAAGCAEPLRIAAIAASLGLEPARLTRMFKRTYGCTPTEMLREERVARAAALIREGRCSLTEVAQRCGFYDQSHLSNVFRRVMGMSPRQYAQQTR